MMNNDEIEKRVIQEYKKNLSPSYSVTKSSRFKEDLSMNSIKQISIVSGLCEYFKVDFDDDDNIENFMMIRTIDDLINAIYHSNKV